MRFRFFAGALITLTLALQSTPRTNAQRGGRGAVTLPDGSGKTLVESTCSSCHALALITGSPGYTRDGWQNLIATMVTGRRLGSPEDGVRGAWRSVGALLIVAVFGFWWMQWHAAPAGSAAEISATASKHRDHDRDHDHD